LPSPAACRVCIFFLIGVCRRSSHGRLGDLLRRDASLCLDLRGRGISPPPYPPPSRARRGGGFHGEAPCSSNVHRKGTWVSVGVSTSACDIAIMISTKITQLAYSAIAAPAGARVKPRETPMTDGFAPKPPRSVSGRPFEKGPVGNPTAAKRRRSRRSWRYGPRGIAVMPAREGYSTQRGRFALDPR
jgi:hypothetical protein